MQRALMRANPATLTATGVPGRLERLRDVWLPDKLVAWFRIFWGRGWMVPSRPDTNLCLISPRTATPSFPPPTSPRPDTLAPTGRPANTRARTVPVHPSHLCALSAYGDPPPGPVVWVERGPER